MSASDTWGAEYMQKRIGWCSPYLRNKKQITIKTKYGKVQSNNSRRRKNFRKNKTLSDWGRSSYGEFIDYSYEKTVSENFSNWVKRFKTLNNEVLNDNITIDDINNYIKGHFDESMYTYKNYRINDLFLIENVDEIFGESKIKAIDFNNKKDFPINRMFQFYNLRPCGTYDIGNLTEKYASEKMDLLAFPNEYNLFNEIGNDYIINYYPEKVELNNNVLKITLKIDNPITDSLQTVDIVNKISHYFSDEMNVGKIEKNFDLIIAFDYNNISCNVFDEFDSRSLFSEGFKEDEYNDLVILYDRAPWYPNEEAQKIIKNVFTNISENFVNDTQYSIFNEIKKVSEQENIEYEKVEEIVMNYLWQSFMSW